MLLPINLYNVLLMKYLLEGPKTKRQIVQYLRENYYDGTESAVHNMLTKLIQYKLIQRNEAHTVTQNTYTITAFGLEQWENIQQLVHS